MSTEDIKDVIIERVKSMKKREVEIFYGRLVEEENYSDKDFFENWSAIPAAHKISIEKGLDDLQKGKKRSFDLFAKSFAKKHGIQ